MFDKVVEISLLYDFYGQLLTEKQREVMRLYHEDDFSLGEIAENISISRQAVHDTVKKSEKILQEYEEKLKLLTRFKEKEQENLLVNQLLDKIIESNNKDDDLIDALFEIKKIISKND